MATTAMAGANAGRLEAVIMRRVPQAALVGGAVAAVANLLLLAIGRAVGAVEALALPNGLTFGVAPVLMNTIVATIGAALVYAGLGAIGRIKRPITVFRIVALGLFLLMFLSPFSVAGAGAGFITFLELMHVATAAAIVWSLTTLAGRRGA